MKKLAKTKSAYLMVLLNMVIFYFFYKWFLHNINTSQLISNLKLVSFPAFFVAIFINIIAMSFYGKRLSCITNISYPAGFIVSAIGNAANNILPFRLGEIFRIYFSNKIYDIPTVKSLLLIFIERLSDLIAIGCIGMAVLINTPLNYHQHLRLLIIPFCGLIFLIFLPFVFKIKSWRFLSHSKLESLIETILQKIRAFIDKGLLLPTIGYTLLIWIFTVISFYIFFKMNLNNYSFSILDALAMTFFTTLSLVISTVPSGIGFFEAGMVFYLTKQAGVEQNNALALALLFHITVVLPQFFFLFYFSFLKRKQLFYFKVKVN